MKKFRPTLRLVISAVSALVVLVVAATTLAITITVSMNTVRDVGERHSVALASSARAQIEEFMQGPSRQLRIMNDGFRQDLDVSTRTANKTAYARTLWRLMYASFIGANFSYSSCGYLMDDWTASRAEISLSDENVLYGHVRTYTSPGNGGMWHEYAADIRTAAEVPNVRTHGPPIVLNTDPRFAAYFSAIPLIGSNPNTVVFPVALYSISEHRVQLTLPLLRPIFDRNMQFLGVASAAVYTSSITEFIHTVRGTPNTQIFVVDSSGFLMGSTHNVPFSTTTAYPRASVPVLANGCTSTVDTEAAPYATVYVACRRRATTFDEYPPLPQLASELNFRTGVVDNVQRMSVDGTRYFAVTASIASGGIRFWSMSVLLFLPESDVLGDIVRGRNLAIGITAAVFVLASMLSFALTYAMLQPLATVSRQMLFTAKLRETEFEKNYSRLAEIQDLQKAYVNMNTAIQSFTRYVPRDVVKDLMSSGQLCTIQMTPQMCTMLFVDIAGFTSICERVPPDALSELVSRYFDRASRIVMEHDGLIDKYIGDCIMAVWGAPFGIANQEVKASIAAKLLDRETAVEPLASAWDEAGEILRVRCGVSTGEVLAGNMGSADRMSYTVIGDPVNLAARLESMNKQFDTRVMVSEMTAERMGSTFILRLLMPIAVVGKELPVKVYEVMGLAPSIPLEDQQHFESLDKDNVRGSDDGSQSSGLTLRSASTRRASTAHNGTGENSQDAREMGDTKAAAELRFRKSNRSTVQMLRDAAVKTASDHPATCSQDEIKFAEMHTAAVHLYMSGRFADALAAFERMRRTIPGALLYADQDPQRKRTAYAGKSIDLVEGLCRQYAATGAPADFDGVYRALEK